jgi:hypothetical protein
MSWLPGINRLEAQLEADRNATRDHRTWEGDALRAIKTEAGEIKDRVDATNGKVADHAIEIAVIKEAERQAAIMQAAKIEADAVIVAKRLTWRQGLTFGAFGALASGIVLAIIYGSGIA